MNDAIDALGDRMIDGFETGNYEGNNKSKRVQEKCGFQYQWKSEDVDVPLMHEKRTGHVSLMTKQDWEADQNKVNVEKAVMRSIN